MHAGVQDRVHSPPGKLGARLQGHAARPLPTTCTALRLQIPLVLMLVLQAAAATAGHPGQRDPSTSPEPPVLPQGYTFHCHVSRAGELLGDQSTFANFQHSSNASLAVFRADFAAAPQTSARTRAAKRGWSVAAARLQLADDDLSRLVGHMQGYL